MRIFLSTSTLHFILSFSLTLSYLYLLPSFLCYNSELSYVSALHMSHFRIQSCHLCKFMVTKRFIRKGVRT
jgi:hypothetical protein